MSEELKPCPFCGGAARIESNRDWHRLYADHDDDCIFDAEDADLMYPATDKHSVQLVEDWNRRATPPSPSTAPTCTCPSGDGSLRWPCPEHPPSTASEVGELRCAAEDVVKRWDSPLWKSESTAELIHRLRAALAAKTAGREGGLLDTTKTPETRMDTGFEGGLLPGVNLPSTAEVDVEAEFNAWFAIEYGPNAEMPKAEYSMLKTGYFAARRTQAEGVRDAEELTLYRWMRDNRFNSLHITRNGDHACNYVTAKQWIEECQPEDFDRDDPAEVQAMKATDTIWRVQVYPNTPIGFYAFHGSTLTAALHAAIAATQKGEESGK